jgi:hypothetical protein
MGTGTVVPGHQHYRFDVLWNENRVKGFAPENANGRNLTEGEKDTQGMTG